MKDPRQKRIHKRLLLLGPGAADFYLDACLLMSEKCKLQSTTHLVSHLLREIESSLRDVLEISPKKVPQKTERKEIKDKHAKNICSILEELEIPLESPIAKAWLSVTGSENENALHKRAHRDSLSSPRPIDESFAKFWDEMESVLDFILEKFEDRFLKSFDLIDILVKTQNPTEDEIKKFTKKIPNNTVAYNHFFSQLPSADWIIPLQRKGIFQKPSLPIREDGYISFPIWPQAIYLSQMAKTAPNEVLEVILKIPFNDNLSVHQHFADAALAMPQALSAKWVEHELKWIKKQKWLYLIFPEKLANLINHLINGNQIEIAFLLSQNLFALKKGNKKNKEVSSSSKPRALMDINEYERTLKKVMPELVKIDGVKSFHIFSDFLESAILLSSKNNIKGSGEDASHIWRPKIAYSKRHYTTFQDLWVTAAVYAGEAIINNDSTKAELIIDDLLKGKSSFKIFKRIAFYLLEKIPSPSPSILKKVLLNKSYFAQSWSKNEYDQLLKINFKKLTSTEQNKILSWVKQGPKQLTKSNKRRLSKKETEALQYWQLQNLHPISQDLPTKWKKTYDKLIKKFGDPKPQDPDFDSGPWMGPTSPKDVPTLKEMNIEDLIDYLKNWTPSEGPFFPSREGLGRNLKEIILSDPQKYALAADHFINLHPIYIYFFLSAFHQITMNHGTFTWNKIFVLIQWILTQSTKLSEKNCANIGTNWQQVRQIIARLIFTGLCELPAEIPHNFNIKIWEILEPLSADTDLTVEIENKEIARGCAVEDLAATYTRPEAISAIILYAVWHFRHYKTKPAFTLTEIPRVKKILEKHLSFSIEPLLSVHSAYGTFFQYLVQIDQSWAQLNKDKVFDKSHLNLFKSAWNTYIISSSPSYKIAFNLLYTDYKYAIENLIPHSTAADLQDSEHLLSEHIMTFYWLGWIKLDEPTDILNLFYKYASDSLKAHAIHFVGRSLFNQESQCSQEILNRLKLLWEWRLQNILTENIGNDTAKELSAFGWWFVSSKFDEEWSIQNLFTVLQNTKKTEADHLVIEKLESMMDNLPMQTLACLEQIIENTQESWKINSLEKSITSILTKAITHTDSQIINEGAKLINKLGVKGHVKFRKLLES